MKAILVGAVALVALCVIVQWQSGSFKNLTAAVAGSTLAAPSNLKATVSNSTSIILTWKDNSSDETGFSIDESLGGTVWYGYTSVKPNVTTVTVTGLTEERDYSFRVRAAKGNSYSSYATVKINLPANKSKIKAPSDITVTYKDSNSATFTWKDNSSDETGFVLEKEGSGLNYVAIKNYPANTTTATMTGLSPYTTYRYRLRAIKGSDYSTSSNFGFLTTRSVSSSLAAPSNLRVTAIHGDNIEFKWQDNSSDETGFILQGNSVDPSNEKFWRAYAGNSGVIAANTTTAIASNLGVNTTYYFRIQALKGTTTSVFTPVITVITGEELSSPSEFGVSTVSPTSVTLSWKNNQTDETGFEMQYSLDAYRWNSYLPGTYNRMNLPAGSTTYVINGLKPKTAYWFWLKAKRYSQVSYSKIVTITTPESGTASQPAYTIFTDDLYLEPGVGQISKAFIYGSSYTQQLPIRTGWVAKDVLVDGVSVGAVSSYTFDNIDSNHSIATVLEDVRNR